MKVRFHGNLFNFLLDSGAKKDCLSDQTILRSDYKHVIPTEVQLRSASNHMLEIVGKVSKDFEILELIESVENNINIDSVHSLINNNDEQTTDMIVIKGLKIDGIIGLPGIFRHKIDISGSKKTVTVNRKEFDLVKSDSKKILLSQSTLLKANEKRYVNVTFNSVYSVHSSVTNFAAIIDCPYGDVYIITDGIVDVKENRSKVGYITYLLMIFNFPQDMR